MGAGLLRSTPVVVDGDTLTLRIHAGKAEPSAGVKVRLLAAEAAHGRDDPAVLEGSAAAVAYQKEEEVKVAWAAEGSAALLALRGSRVRVEVVVSPGVTLFSFGFKT